MRPEQGLEIRDQGLEIGETASGRGGFYVLGCSDPAMMN